MPRPCEVNVHAVALVLREYHDFAVATVGEVGQWEVDQAVMASEGDRRFGTVEREGQKAFAFSSSQNHRKCPRASPNGHGPTVPPRRR